MDSTADFVELDDCRVEGGQLTTFTTGATFTQFEKNEYKGAKTLITIESDDGKVQNDGSYHSMWCFWYCRTRYHY